MKKSDVFLYCRDYGRVPVFRKIYADMNTPVMLLKKIARRCDCYYLFESVKEQRFSRYSFLGLEPKSLVTVNDGVLTLTENGREERFYDPVAKLKEILSSRKSPAIKGLPVFTGGAVGYLGYEMSKYFDKAVHFGADRYNDLPEAYLMLIDKLIVYDHHEQLMYLVVNMDGSAPDYEQEYERVTGELDGLEQLVKSEYSTSDSVNEGFSAGAVRSNITKERYMDNVERAKEYIRKGDIFQVVPSQRFSAECTGSLIDVYRRLRVINPSPYLYYIKIHGLEIAGCSPETLVKLHDGRVTTYPIAGTRKRGATEAEDLRMAEELAADPKELAEHNMLVDLGRNDIGKISKFGSVRVDKYLSVERYSHVMHLTSMVSGEVREGIDGLDAIGAVMPAGTLSGAPKIRAMQIIDELEGESRCVYGGAISYLGYNGNMDCCIAIRTLVKHNGVVSAQAGGGVVLDSDPESEYQESLNKAGALLAALEGGNVKKEMEKGKLGRGDFSLIFSAQLAEGKNYDINN